MEFKDEFIDNQRARYSPVCNITIDTTTKGDLEALSVFNHPKVTMFTRVIDSEQRYAEVLRHEVIGHMVPRKFMTPIKHAVWCARLAIKFKGTRLYADIADLYRTDNPVVIGDEIAARVAEKEYHWFDHIKAMFGNKESALRCDLKEMINTVYDSKWGPEYTPGWC